MDTTFREVLSQMSQANSGAGPTFLVSDALTSITTSELEGTTAPASTSSPACRVSTMPPVPPASDILAAGTAVGQPFSALALGLKHKKWDCSTDSTPEGQSSKRVHAGTNRGSISSGCSTLPIQPVASHNSEQPEPVLINFPFSPDKAAANANDRLAAEAFGSTIDHDKDSVVEVTRGDANQSGHESESSSDSQESVADSDPKSETGDCLMCSDTEEAAINSAHKKFWKKVMGSCSITKGCLWSKAKLKWIGDSCKAVQESNYEAVKREWDLTLKEDHHSFEVNKMTDRSKQLL